MKSLEMIEISLKEMIHDLVLRAQNHHNLKIEYEFKILSTEQNECPPPDPYNLDIFIHDVVITTYDNGINKEEK